MAFNISAPQTKFDIDGYGLAKAQLLMSQFNPYQGITDWLEKQGQEIADRNAIDAQDYLDNLNLDEITRAKAQGKDILKEYAKGKYFFDRTNKDVRKSAKERSKAESEYVLGKYRKALADAMNSDSLQDGNYRQLLNNLGMAGRTAEEMEQYNDSYQDAWLKRYEQDLQRQAAEEQFGDPTGANTTNYVQNQLAKAGINKRSVDDYTGNNLLPAMQSLSNDKLRQFVLNNADANFTAEGLKQYQTELDKLSTYASPDEVARAQMLQSRKYSAMVGEAERQAWQNLDAMMKDNPEIAKRIGNMSTVDLYRSYLIPAISKLTHLSPNEVIKATSGSRQDIYGFNEENAKYFYDIAAEDAKNTYNSWLLNGNTDIANTLFNNPTLSSEVKGLKEQEVAAFKKNLDSAGVGGVINRIMGLHKGMDEEGATRLLIQALGLNGDLKKFLYTGNNENLQTELKKKVKNISDGMGLYHNVLIRERNSNARRSLMQRGAWYGDGR